MPALKPLSAKHVFFSLPAAFLLAALAGLPFPAPAFLVPATDYVVADGDAFETGDALTLAKRARRALSPGPDGVVPTETLLAGPPGPDFLPSIREAIEDAERAAKPGRRIRILTTLRPNADELERLARLRDGSGVHASLILLEPRAPKPVLAIAYRIESGQKTGTVQTLFAPDADAWSDVSVSSDGTRVSSKVSELPGDRALAVPFDRSTGGAIVVEARDERRPPWRKTFALPAADDDEPRALVVGGRPGLTGFVDASYPSKRVAASELPSVALSSYELVVVDGGPLASLGAASQEALRDLVLNGAGSVLLVADSPAFGRPGDAPALESIMPVELLPRTVKKLPDMAVLVLVDRSGSMWGEKFSLAKVTGAEFFRNLKPGDVTALALFADDLEWARRFARNSEGETVRLLEPATAGGGTDLHAALSKCLDAIASVDVPERHVLVVSDGITKPADFPALAARAAAAGVSVSAVAVGDDIDPKPLDALVKGTGGHYYAVTRAEEIPSIVFEDRIRSARTTFGEESTPIYGVDGRQVAVVDAMSRFAPRDGSGVLFADALGDPFFASREFGERSCMILSSDQYGVYTKEFFASREAVSVLKRRLDALFTERPVDASVTLHGRGATVTVRGEGLVEPFILITGAGAKTRRVPTRQAVPGVFAADIDVSGSFELLVSDRGAVAARFPLRVTAGLSGYVEPDPAALRAFAPRPFLPIRDTRVWIALFVLASLVATAYARFVS